MSNFNFGGIQPTVIVKDGTVSSREEHRIKAQEHDAERRRKHQDQQVAMSNQGVGADGGVARLGNQNMINQSSPRLVLWYQKQQIECLSEITMVAGAAGQLEPMFTLVCPKCLERRVPQGQAQLQVRNSHRAFSVDTSKGGPRQVHIGGGQQHIVMEHGKVSVNDIVRCSNTGCGWAVRITDSVVSEV